MRMTAVFSVAMFVKLACMKKRNIWRISRLTLLTLENVGGEAGK